MDNQVLDIKITAITHQYPNKVAIKAGNESISYLELERRSNRSANFLHKKFKNKNVPVILDRSPELIISIIGLFKCGLIYVPVNPLLPQNRIGKIFEETGAESVITSITYYHKIKLIRGKGNSNINIFLIDGERNTLKSNHHNHIYYLTPGEGDDNLKFKRISNKNCYIYFTSGSTGVPHGILGRRRSLAHFIEWEIRQFGIDESFNISQLTPPWFDPFLRDVFVPLQGGGTSCIPSNDALTDPIQLIKWIDKYQITLIHIVPSLFKALLLEINQPHCFRHLEYVLLAGELLRGNDIRKFIEIFKNRIQLVNLYGPTETTLAKFFYNIKQEDIYRPIIPVGKPISGAQALILDNHQNKCRVGKRGEIYIRTPFITSGYYNDPGLNKKRFIKNPYGENSRDIIFKTGDLGRLFPDGNIELSGRVDQQVKIRGFRIEPGEIENRLLTHKDIKEAVVIAHENKEGEKYLCAYVVSDKVISPCIRELREYLSEQLPDYMVPLHFVQLKEIPLTSNGKVDRKKFQAPTLPGMTQPETYIAPRDEIEKKLRDMWTDVLDMPKDIIGIDSNFFDLGGHSLKAALFRAKMHRAFNISVPLEKIFKSPCIRELSGYIKGARQDEFISIEAAEKKEFYELSYNQTRLWLLSQMDPGSPAYHILRGITLRYRVNEKMLEKVFRKLTARHESLRTCFAEVDHAPVQFIRKHVDLPFEIIDISLLKGEEQEKQKERLIAEMQASPFDLAVPPLSRALLVKSHEEEYTLAITMHHIISDGWSMEILEQEFQQLYEGYRNHKEIELETLEFQYKDFTTWHNKWLNNPAFKEKSHGFWKEKLDNIDAFPILELTKNSAVSNKSRESAAYCFVLNKEQKNKLVRLARDNNATLFTVMFSVFNMVLANFSGQREIVCGIPAAGREHISLQNIMGFFVNTLVLKTHVDHDELFTDFIKRVNNDHLEFLHYQGYPLELVLDDLHMKFPGIPVFFNMLNMHDTMVKEELAVTHPFHIEKVRDVKFDLVLYSSEYKNGIEIQCHYRRALFKPGAVEHIIGEYVKLLDFVTDNSTRSIKDYKHSKRRHILNRSINISRGLGNAG